MGSLLRVGPAEEAVDAQDMAVQSADPASTLKAINSSASVWEVRGYLEWGWRGWRESMSASFQEGACTMDPGMSAVGRPAYQG